MGDQPAVLPEESSLPQVRQELEAGKKTAPQWGAEGTGAQYNDEVIITLLFAQPVPESIY